MMRPMTSIKRAPRNRGMVLVTALVMLAVLTLVAVVAMRSTTLDLRMTTNAMLNARAFQGSEGARVQLVTPLDEHVFNQGWPQSAGGAKENNKFTDLPDGLSLVDATGKLYEEAEGQDLAKYGNDCGAGGTDDCRDMTFRLAANGDNTTVDDRSPKPQDISADLFVTSLGATMATGASTAMVGGYEGLGKGSAAGGAYMMFDVRSRGHAANRTESMTGTDTRVLVRN